METQLVWSIDPVTFALHPDKSPTAPFTYRQFMTQDWPACPVCGRIVTVDAINVQAMGDAHPSYLVGSWRCPISCAPGDTPPPTTTPAQYAQDLQGIADRRWPDAGVEVQVQVWRPAEPCSRCGIQLESQVGDDGQLTRARFYRRGELNGLPLRTPHYSVHCVPAEWV